MDAFRPKLAAARVGDVPNYAGRVVTGSQAAVAVGALGVLRNAFLVGGATGEEAAGCGGRRRGSRRRLLGWDQRCGGGEERDGLDESDERHFQGSKD